MPVIPGPVMVRSGFVPNPVPAIVKDVVIPAFQTLGVIEVITGVGS